MTRKALIELIKLRLKNVDSTEQFHPRFIEGVCDLVWASWCSASTVSASQDVNFYTKLYDGVEVDVDGEFFYSVLPSPILNLDRIGGGVISINQINARDNDFKPIREKDFRLMKGQEVNRTGTDIYYYVTYDHVYYGGSMTDEIAEDGVDMRLSIPFSKYDLSEELPLPSGKEMEFVQAAINILVGTPPTNLTNKNTNQ
jgi:hypothetical protein